MNLDFSEEQVMLRDTAARLCAGHHSSDVVRELEGDPTGFRDAFWQGMSEAGLCGIAVAESYGGIGLGSLETAIVHEEMGRTLATSPHLASCVIAASLLQDAGTRCHRAELLPAVASGRKIVVPAWQESGAGADLGSLQVSISGAKGRQTLSGEKVLVPFANRADLFMVPVRDEDNALSVVLVPSERARFRAQPNHADQSLFAIAFERVEIGSDDLLAVEGIERHWDSAMLRGQIAIAAQAVGGASAILQMATEYAGERHQFGQPIGAFQSIAHYLADRVTEIEGARYLAYQAAWACDSGKMSGRSWKRLALMAKLQATAVYRRATVTGVQVHGGMGFSSEADPQLYYRRAKHLQLMDWDPRYLERRIASEVFG